MRLTVSESLLIK